MRLCLYDDFSGLGWDCVFIMTLVVDYDFIIVFRHLLSRNGGFLLGHGNQVKI